MHYEDMDVYKLAEEMADSIWQIVNAWTPFEKEALGKPMIRACDRIAVTIAEGDICASLKETRHWLRCAIRRGLIQEKEVDIISPIMEELAPMLHAYSESMARKSKP